MFRTLLCPKLVESIKSKIKYSEWHLVGFLFFSYFERIKTYHTKEVYVYLYLVQFILSQATDLDPHESSVGRNTCT